VISLRRTRTLNSSDLEIAALAALKSKRLFHRFFQVSKCFITYNCQVSLDGTETVVKLAICDSLSLATVELLNHLGASALEAQNRKPNPSVGEDKDEKADLDGKGLKEIDLIVMLNQNGF